MRRAKRFIVTVSDAELIKLRIFFTSVRPITITKSLTARHSNATQRNETKRNATQRSAAYSGGLRCRCAWSRFIGVAHPGVNGRYYALEITLVSRARRRIAFVFAKPSNREQSIRGSVKLWASSRRRFIHPEDLYFETSLDNEPASHCATIWRIYHFFFAMWDAWIEINALNCV